MIRSIPQRILTPRLQSVFRQFHGRVTSASSAIETENWFMFPRETEGNIYKVNWSLVGEGVTPTQNAFRNARAALLISHLSAKPSGGKVEVTKPVYSGEYQLQESGDKTLPADTFKDISVELKKNLSFAKNLYVEDAAVGSFSSVRMGVRIVSDYPELVVASRALLVIYLNFKYVVINESHLKEKNVMLLYRFKLLLDPAITVLVLMDGISILCCGQALNQNDGMV